MADVPPSVMTAGPAGAIPTKVITRQFLGNTFDSDSQTTYTFNNQSFGIATYDRIIAVHVAAGLLTSRTISSATIGGISASIAVQANSGNALSGIIYARVPSGTSGAISITLSGSAICCGIGRYRIIGLKSATPADTDSGAGLELNAPANSFVIAGICLNIIAAGGAIRQSAGSKYLSEADGSYDIDASGFSTGISWSGVDEDYDQSIDDGTSSASAAITAAVWAGY